VKEMPSAAISILPTLGEKRVKIQRRRRLHRSPASVGWCRESQPPYPVRRAISEHDRPSLLRA
jgi:hypothetical protein